MRVTFGRYLPKNSIIHAMDPRFKMVMIIFLMIAIFMPIGFTGYFLCAAVILSIYAISKISFRMLLGLLPPVIFVFVIIFTINSLLSHPDPEFIEKLANLNGSIPGISVEKIAGGFKGNLFGNDAEIQAELIKAGITNTFTSIGFFVNWKFIWLSEEALYGALIMAFRIYLMISLTCILTATTSPLQLTLAIEDLLYPLKWIGIPVYILSMIISIALRMIPTLIDEAGRIMKAQSSRGIDIKNGKKMDKLKGLTSLIIPLLVSAFQKAEDLSYAMEARGYDPYSKRTRYLQFKFKFIDLAFLLFCALFMIFIILYSQDVSFFGYISLPRVDQILGK